MNVDDIFWMSIPALLRVVQELEQRLDRRLGEGLDDPPPPPAPPQA